MYFLITVLATRASNFRLPRVPATPEPALASAENLNKLGLPKMKEWPQCHKRSSRQECQSFLCRKEKEQSHQSRSSDHEMGESQNEREPHVGEREGHQNGSKEREKGELYTKGRWVTRRKVSKQREPP